jgi:hypothetical protein
MKRAYASPATKRRREKAAIVNKLAAADAHVAQVNRHIETVQANAAVLDANGKRLAAALEDAQSLAASRAASIDAFKQETLALTVEAAELRGYIRRVLEDDAAEEALTAPVPQQDSVVETRFIPRAVNDHKHTGPSAMDPMAIRRDTPFVMHTATGWDSYNLNRAQAHRTAGMRSMLDEYPEQIASTKHWTQR